MTPDEDWDAAMRRSAAERAVAVAGARRRGQWSSEVERDAAYALGHRVNRYVHRFLEEVHAAHGPRLWAAMSRAARIHTALGERRRHRARWSRPAGAHVPVPGPAGWDSRAYALLASTVAVHVEPAFVMWRRHLFNAYSPQFFVTTHGLWGVLRFQGVDAGSVWTGHAGWVVALGFRSRAEFVAEPDLFQDRPPADFAPAVLRVLTECVQAPL
ncbi:hypothetical protein [Catellatospora sp. NPDC049609]|uniref:hypothetical protein n=1 Tax=Catellatospora sp. NPDC049609 TaxID=3155505 RepID=UPI003416C2C2